MSITQETNEIRALARDFAAAELRPHVEKWDHDRALDTGVLQQVAELGFFGMLVPESSGGMGMDLSSYLAALEELAWGEPAVALTVAASSFVMNVLSEHGSAEQKRRWLEPMARGEVLGCFAVSEETGGIDSEGPPASATKSGDAWLLNGAKQWVTNARSAGVALMLVRTGGKGSRTAGAFLVPTGASGFEVGERETTMGYRSLDIARVKLNNVRVGADALVGDAAQGMTYAHAALDLGRLGIAAQAVGIAQAALDHARGYADEREQFGQKLRMFEGIQFKLAEMATRVHAARALTMDAAVNPGTQASSEAKLFASEAAMWVTTQAVQIYGGYGYMRDYPVEKLMRDAKATEILEGTNELQKVLIAEQLYKQ
jgi:alkylation response protein AidB-like acyl-CoA dehydrogenase